MSRSKFSLIPTNTLFDTSKGQFRKVDDLYYEDLSTGFLSVWNPMFEATITTSDQETPAPSKGDAPEFLTDPQSRITTRNPNFNKEHPAVYWMNELWGSGEFDCESDNYELMVNTAIEAIRHLKTIPTTADAAIKSAKKRKQHAQE